MMAEDSQRRPADDEDRIREEAYRLWLAEGRPMGRAERHWAEAKEIVATRDSSESTLRPLDETTREPIEDTGTLANQGDIPTLDDQETQTPPSWKAAKEIADAEPLSVERKGAPPKRAARGRKAR
jgi:hypothetical protein